MKVDGIELRLCRSVGTDIICSNNDITIDEILLVTLCDGSITAYERYKQDTTSITWRSSDCNYLSVLFMKNAAGDNVIGLVHTSGEGSSTYVHVSKK
jgi:hypothetical protein